MQRLPAGIEACEMMSSGQSGGRSDPFIDLRSDTYNLPTQAMLARLGSAVEGPRIGGAEEHTRELERAVSALTSKEAAVFLPTCSAANLLALMALANPAENVVVDADSHIRWLEANSASVTGGVQLVPVPRAGSVVDPVALVDFAERSSHFGLPPLGLICVENSHNNAGGTVATRSDMKRVSSMAREYGARVHVDGARIFNAAARLDAEVSELCAPATTVALSLNKSLGAPYGAVLAGPEDVIAKARNLRVNWASRPYTRRAYSQRWRLRLLKPTWRIHASTTARRKSWRDLSPGTSRPSWRCKLPRPTSFSLTFWRT